MQKIHFNILTNTTFSEKKKLDHILLTDKIPLNNLSYKERSPFLSFSKIHKNTQKTWPGPSSPKLITTAQN